MIPPATVPARAWVVTFAGTAVNLCLGILYAWSVWKAALVPSDIALYGTPMTEKNEGWTYLSDAQGTWAYAICGLTFALFMIPGGRIQDRYGPKTRGDPRRALPRVRLHHRGTDEELSRPHPRLRRPRRHRHGPRLRGRDTRRGEVVSLEPARTDRRAGRRGLRGRRDLHLAAG